MNVRQSIFGAAALAVLGFSPAAAQDAVRMINHTGDSAPSVTADTSAPAETAAVSNMAQIVIQHMRPADQRGLNVFEAPRTDDIPFTGFRLDWSASFTQQFQALGHENQALPKPDGAGVDQNQLVDLGWGFNNAAANLGLNVQLAPGIRVALTTYLSSRHHSEAWVKDGYIQIDESPFDIAPLNTMMDYLTVKVGHFELDYGDAHYRRTDNGNAIYNPFVGNLIMDAFTTEIGGQVYFRNDMGLIAMAGVTGGEIKGEVRYPDRRAPAFLGKLGFDRQLDDDLRIRLMGSAFTQDRAMNNTLYGGDRAGSRYFFVLENTTASAAGQAWSGNLNPGFRSQVTAFMVNPFVKFHGLELFGTWEQSSGMAATETVEREWTQYAGDVVYRFFDDESLYLAGRYNTAQGELQGISNEVGVDRVQLGAGWFLTPSVLLKGEWVTQSYNDFPATDIRSEGQFDGFVMEGVISF